MRGNGNQRQRSAGRGDGVDDVEHEVQDDTLHRMPIDEAPDVIGVLMDQPDGSQQDGRHDPERYQLATLRHDVFGLEEVHIAIRNR